MAGNASVPNAFAALSGNIALALLDQNNAAILAYLNDPTNRVSVGVDSGVANGYVLTSTPPVPNYTNPFIVWFVPNATNTASSTANDSGKGALTIFKDTGTGPVLLGGGEIVAGNFCGLLMDPTLNSGAGGFHLINPAAAPPVIVSAVRNLIGTRPSNTTLTFTADEAIVETGLGGTGFRTANLNLTLNAATVGAGGMDTGSQPTTGYLSVYLIFNPTTATFALLGTVASQTSIYGGTHMPAGFTASALLALWPSGAGPAFATGIQLDREFFYDGSVNIFAGTPSPTTLTTQSIAAGVPAAAKTATGLIGFNTNAGAGNGQFVVAYDANAGAQQHPFCVNVGATEGAGFFGAGTFRQLPLVTAQTLFWSAHSAGLVSRLSITGYTF